MTEIEYKVADLINFSSNQKPLEFADAFKSIITDRVASAIEAKKTSIAQTMFNPSDDTETDENEYSDDTETEVEDEEDAEVA